MWSGKKKKVTDLHPLPIVLSEFFPLRKAYQNMSEQDGDVRSIILDVPVTYILYKPVVTLGL